MSSPTLTTLPARMLREADPAAHRARIRVAALQDAQALAEHLAAWEDLAAHALEANPFYEPWMFLPALEAMAADRKLVLLLVYADGPAGKSRLIGFFPLERLPGYKGLPVCALRLWSHAHCYLGTPLVRRGYPRESLEGFFQWFAQASGASLLELHDISGEGPFHQALIHHFERHAQTVFFSERTTRALFRPHRSADAYLRAAIPGKSLKEFRRLKRRLAEQGPLEYRFLAQEDRAQDWIRAFLELERRGWKGRAGTALASAPASRAFFETIAREASRRGRLAMHGLYLGERALALSCKIRAGDGAFAFKIAFDEAYGQFSPGVLLELEHIVHMHRDARLRWMDSCAISGHVMANRLWRDRRAMETVTVAAGGAGSLVVLLLPLLRWVWRRLRGLRPARSAQSQESAA